MDELTSERFGSVPWRERYAKPRRPPAVVNRWGDTAEDQKRRREDLVRAMAEYDREAA